MPPDGLALSIPELRLPAAPARVSDGDLAVCRGLLRRGSKSFSAASLLLPARARVPATVFYAFCRVADDAVDLSDDPARAVEQLSRRLDRIYQGRPDDDPVDRAFAEVVRVHEVPRALPWALIEGFSWDAAGRVYGRRSDVIAYSARVAAAVGVVMTVLMGVRDRDVLARACDLGVAMQLTNIARDVGEDARNGRVYLPRAWLEFEGVDPDALVAAPRFEHRLGRVVERLLSNADVFYARAEAGIAGLPQDCRAAIWAARLIYADIGRVIRARDFDSVSGRAFTSKARKLQLLLRALWRSRRSHRPGPAATLPAAPECQFLIDAVTPPPRPLEDRG